MVKPRFDIQHFNWVKAAFVASLRAIFGSDYVPPEYKFVDDEEQTKIVIYTAFPYRYLRLPMIVVDASSSNADVTYLGAQERVSRVELKEFRSRIVKSATDLDQVLFDDEPVRYNDIEQVIVTDVDPSAYSVVDIDGNVYLKWNQTVFNEGVPFEIQIVFKEPIPYLYFTGILRVHIKITIYAATVTDVEKLVDLVTVFLRFFLRDKLADLKITYTSIDVSGISVSEWNGELIYSSTVTIGNCHTEYELIFPESLLGYVEQINIEGIIKQILAEETETKQQTIVK